MQEEEEEVVEEDEEVVEEEGDVVEREGKILCEKRYNNSFVFVEYS